MESPEFQSVWNNFLDFVARRWKNVIMIMIMIIIIIIIHSSIIN